MAFLDKKFTKSNHSADKSMLSLSGMQRPLEALTSTCQAHPGELQTNYCSNSKCLIPLCPDCIELHLEEHKRSQLFPEIQSMKNARVKCIRKVHKLSQMFQAQLGAIDGPKTIEKICAETVAKLGQIKAFMIQSIEAYFQSLEESMKARVSESSAVLREMDSIHGRLRMIMEELAALDEKLHSNSPATVMTIRKVFSLDGTGLNESFMNELGNYNSIRKRANIDIHFDENKFRQGLTDSVSFDRVVPGTERPTFNRPPMVERPAFEKTKTEREEVRVMPPEVSTERAVQQPLPQSEKIGRNIHISEFGGGPVPPIQRVQTPVQRTETPKSQSIRGESMSLEIRDGPRAELRPLLHFFESDSKNLHLIHLPSLQKQVITLRSQYAIPHFHKSLLVSTGEIFITGGLLEEDVKNTFVGRYDPDTRSFNDSFASVVERSSHSLCQLDGQLYIIGGFGRDGAQRIVQRVGTQTGFVEKDPPSRYGGPNISIAISVREIVKLSEEGVQIFNTVKRQWTQVSVPNYLYYESCAGIDINDNQLFIFGGYARSQSETDTGVTDSYVLDIADRSTFYVRGLNRFRLPVAEGFWNNTPMVFRREVYALQNIESEDADDCMENARRVLKFDGEKWHNLSP